jgi:hypothetical protein
MIIKLLLIIIIVSIIFNYKDTITNTDKKQYILPKIIYTYYNNIETEPIIQAHIDTWKRNLSSDWEIKIINNTNIYNYVSKEFILKYGYLDVIRFSDFIRLELLKKTGGVWIDGGIIITNGKFLDIYYYEMIEKEYDICLYEYPDRTNQNTQYLENWFFIAPKDSVFINDLYYEFDKANTMGFMNYKVNVLFNSNVDLSKTIGYENGTYLMQHAIINYLHTIGKKYKKNIKNANHSMFKLQNHYKWNIKDTVSFLENNNNWSQYYAIKLTGNFRRGIHNKSKYIMNLHKI